jgi:hypothetical protein
MSCLPRWWPPIVASIVPAALVIRCRKRPKLRQRPVLRDPNRDRGHAEDGAGLFRRHADSNPQDKQLALRSRELSQQEACQLCIAATDGVVLRSRGVVGSVLQLTVKLRRTRGGSLGVRHLVCGDTEDECFERTAFVTVAR